MRAPALTRSDVGLQFVEGTRASLKLEEPPADHHVCTRLGTAV
jgi:hypothetical protein